MSSTDNYDTNITFQFKEETTSKGFNHLLAGIIPQAIYRGGTLQINSGDSTKVDILPYMAWKDANDEYSVAVKISTGENVTVSPTPTNNLIIMKYDWIDNVIQNYPDYYTIPNGSEAERDIIFGIVLFSGSSNIVESFDYTNRSENPFTLMKYFDSYYEL